MQAAYHAVWEQLHFELADYTTSRNNATPRSVQSMGSPFVRNWAVKISCRKRASVAYTGHWYVSRVSAFSAGIALT